MAAAVSTPSARMQNALAFGSPQMTLRPAVLSSPIRRADFFGSRALPDASHPRSAFPAPPGAR